MFRIKFIAVVIFAAIGVSACFTTKPTGFVIADSKTYEASLFRQNCAICHGPEANGRTLDDGKQVPSLRKADFKFRTEAEIYKQISGGGNGMPPFRDQLTDREIKLMVKFVHDDLRNNEP